jgi:hypothetical protein
MQFSRRIGCQSIEQLLCLLGQRFLDEQLDANTGIQHTADWNGTQRRRSSRSKSRLSGAPSGGVKRRRWMACSACPCWLWRSSSSNARYSIVTTWALKERLRGWPGDPLLFYTHFWNMRSCKIKNSFASSLKELSSGGESGIQNYGCLTFAGAIIFTRIHLLSKNVFTPYNQLSEYS